MGRPRERTPVAFRWHPSRTEGSPRIVIPSPPRLRGDLTIREQQTANGTLFVFKDPASGAFFRLGPLEEFIVRQLDGATPLEAVRQRTEARFGSELPAATLAAFIQRLDKAGLLQGEE